MPVPVPVPVPVPMHVPTSVTVPDPAHVPVSVSLLGLSHSIDFHIPIIPYPWRGKGGRREIFGPAGGSVTLTG